MTVAEAAVIAEASVKAVAEYEARKLEILESIRVGVCILWATQIGSRPWELSWHSVLVKFLFCNLGWAVIYWPSIRRWAFRRWAWS